MLNKKNKNKNILVIIFNENIRIIKFIKHLRRISKLLYGPNLSLTYGVSEATPL